MITFTVTHNRLPGDAYYEQACAIAAELDAQISSSTSFLSRAACETFLLMETSAPVRERFGLKITPHQVSEH